MTELKQFGSFTTKDGVEIIIDGSHEEVKAYRERYPDTNEDVAIGYVVQSLKKRDKHGLVNLTGKKKAKKSEKKEEKKETKKKSTKK